MVSLMDHSPGVGQYANLDFYRALRRRGGLDDEYIERRILELQAQRERTRIPNRRALLERVAGRDIALASHDDRTEEEIAENAADGIGISEFPVTMAAAQAAKAAGMQVIAGAPNIVRGGSHSGNVSAADLLETGAVDAFASDYVPNSLVEAAFQCAQRDRPAAGGRAGHRPARRGWPAWPIAAGWRPGSAPTSCACACTMDCRWCARSGGPVSASPDGPRRACRGLLRAAAGRSAVRGRRRWLGRDPAERRAGAAAGYSGHRGGHRRAAALRLPCDAEAADAAGGRAAVVRRGGGGAQLAGRTAPFDLPPLAVSDVFGFLALRETVPCPPLQALADACVEHLDPFRAPPSDAELARRRRANLTPRQDAMLVRWGYPYVFDTWFFHMTLTRRLTAEEKRRLPCRRRRHISRVRSRLPRRVTDICLFVQPAPGEPFVIEQRLPLRG